MRTSIINAFVLAVVACLIGLGAQAQRTTPCSNNCTTGMVYSGNIAVQAGGIALVNKNAVSGNAPTIPSTNMTGVNLIFLGLTGNATFTTPTDSSSNTYTQAGSTVGTDVCFTALYYKFAPTVSATMTFTSNAGFGAMFVLGFSGAASSPLDQTNQATAGGPLTTIQPGSVTPSVNNEVLVSVATISHTNTGNTYSVNGGYTITNQFADDGATTFGGAAGYLIQTTAAASNPTWTSSSAQNCGTASIATFK